MKNLFLVLAMVLIQACNPGPVSPTPPPIPEVSQPAPTPPVSQPVDVGHVSQGSTPIGPEYPVKDVEKVFTVVVKDTNYTPAQKEKLSKAEAILAKLMNSPEFKKKVLDFTYGGKKAFVDNDGLTNEQIWDKLFKGAEALQPAVNYQMDLTVEMYYQKTSTIGYTYPDVLKIFTNSKYHNSYTPCDIAGNLFHEWTHKMGFDHAAKYSTSRDYSVPYGLGYLVEEVCNAM